MAVKYQLITELYRRTGVSVAKSPQAWQSFLSSACRNYKCRFDEQLLIYAQRPDAVAVAELGTWNKLFKRWVNKDSKPYWSWYGFDSRVEWCACFVSWCAEQCGYLESGIIPKYSLCSDGVNWFRNNGQWQGRDYEPTAGNLIFFDWEGDGTIDHTGIVEKSENGTVYTVEGNSGDECKQRNYPVGSSVIYGYGIPAY